jgi:peptide methionine sulfoxide reductase MsrA
MNSDYKKAMFAGGCFWCTQSAFADKEGVIETTAGYTGGKIALIPPTVRFVMATPGIMKLWK